MSYIPRHNAQSDKKREVASRNRKDVILALDLATSTGWAVTGGLSGAVDWQPYKHDYGQLDVAFRRWLADMLVEHRVSLLVVEAPVLRGSASFLLVGLYFSAHSVAALHGVARTDADSNKVRRELLGRERLNEIRRAAPSKNQVRKRLKAAMIAWARERGYAPGSDDEADALALLEWTTAQRAGATPP